MPIGLVGVLGGIGIDAVHAEQEGNRNREDSFHWAEAARLKRILVSCNSKHFWNDRMCPLKDSPGVIVVDAGGNQDWEHVGILVYAFASYLKTLTQGPVGQGVFARTKIRLTGDRIVWKYLTYESQVETREEPWGPYWT